MGIIIGAIKIIVVLGTLITIHELGHFLVAKACKVKVHKFSIGFGPKVLKKQGKETEYTLRLIPFGGFVQMEGEEERSEDDRAFNKKPIYQRILIVAAGAIVNIIFAIIIYFFIAFSANIYFDNIIASLPEDSHEYLSGLRSGDTILSVNGKKVLVGYDITDIISSSKDDKFVFEVYRDNKIEKIDVTIPISKKGLLGIIYNKENTIVGVSSDSPAANADLQSGDVILKINDTDISNWEQIASIIAKLHDTQISLLLQRGNEYVDVMVVTTSSEDRFYEMNFGVTTPQGFDRVLYAANETGDYFNATIYGIATLFKGKTENVEVMGPVGIADEIASTEGWSEFFYLMSAISLSLGIFNLFPIPALDGGKILLLVIEKIRKKPFSQNTEAVATLIGFTFIILLAIVVTVSDVIGLF